MTTLASPDMASPGHPATTSRRALLAALLGFTVITVDVSGVNIALPYLHASLGGGMAGLQWVVDAYALMFAALMLSAGAVTDRVGSARAYATGIAVFTLASLACAAAPSMPFLVAARIAQGAAAALVMPSSLALVRAAYSDARERARAIAVWTVGGAAAMAVGPVLGGLLSEYADWRWVFLINAPIGALIVALVRGLRDVGGPVARPGALDPVGQALAVVAMAGLSYAVIEGGRSGWDTRGPVLAAVVATLALAAFIRTEQRIPHPVVPLAMVRQRRVLVALVGGFGVNLAFYGGIFLLGLYYQEVRGWSGAEAGLMFVVPALLTTLANIASPRLAERLGRRTVIVCGQGVLAVAMLVLVPLSLTTPVWLMLVLLVPFATGGALAITAITAELVDAVDAARVGVATGLLNAIRQTGGALAVAIFGSLGCGADDVLTLPGLHTCLLVAAICVALSGLAACSVPNRSV